MASDVPDRDIAPIDPVEGTQQELAEPRLHGGQELQAEWGVPLPPMAGNESGRDARRLTQGLFGERSE